MPTLDRRKQNIIWLISLILLTSITIIVYETGGKSGEHYDENKFTLEINSIITSVTISSEEDLLNFEYKNGDWIVNDSFSMDPGMRDAFFTVISAIKVKRKVGVMERDSIANFLEKEGRQVKILNNQNLIKSYIVGGDEISGVSYFMNNEEWIPYVVTLPGYDSYVAGIFAVPENDWRNRFLFELDWSNLKFVEVYYQEQPDLGFEIRYREDFFYLDNSQEPLDSAAIFDFIGELRNLQCEKFISLHEEPTLDSVSSLPPRSTLRIGTIGEEDQILEVFPQIKGHRYILGRFNNKLHVLFNPRALTPIFLKKDDWD